MMQREDYAPEQVFLFSTKFLNDLGILLDAIDISGSLPYNPMLEISEMAMISMTGKQAKAMGLVE